LDILLSAVIMDHFGPVVYLFFSTFRVILQSCLRIFVRKEGREGEKGFVQPFFLSENAFHINVRPML